MWLETPSMPVLRQKQERGSAIVRLSGSVPLLCFLFQIVQYSVVVAQHEQALQVNNNAKGQVHVAVVDEEFVESHGVDEQFTLRSSPAEARSLTRKSSDVIIGGAGFAGITAAEELDKYGVTFTILEASDLIGGRARCEHLKDTDDPKKTYAVETGPNWISGGAPNPIFLYKKKTKLGGFFQEYTTNLYNKKGKVVVGDYETEWDTEFNKLDPDLNIATKMDQAYWRGEKLSQRCLQLPKGHKLSKKEQKFCDKLCIGLVEGRWFDELKITGKTICKNGHFVPDGKVDMTVTDIMRAANGFFPKTEKKICDARLADYFYQDADMADFPWLTSAKTWFVSDTWIEFDPIDFFILDDRCFSFLAKYQAAQFLKTSKNTKKKIEFKDDRLKFLTKVTKVKWDPEGKKDVVVTYCTTKRVEANGQKPHLYPCVKGTSKKIRSKEFISTFSWGVLQESMKAEKSGEGYEDRAPQFVPPLSSIQPLVEASKINRMAYSTKVYLQFRFKFWPNKEFLVTPTSSGRYKCDFNPMWQPVDIPNLLPGSKILFLQADGQRAFDLAKMDHSDIIDELLPTLNKFFSKQIKKGFKNEGIDRKKLKPSDVKGIFVTRWPEDPLYRGCWKTNRMGSTKELHYGVARRFGNLVFSGEATCFRHGGYTHGAQMAGTRSARELLRNRYGQKQIDVRTLCDYTPDELEG